MTAFEKFWLPIGDRVWCATPVECRMLAQRRDWLHVGCERGHDMQSTGGCNAGCHHDCGCSVPVHVCTRCGDCDYGRNDEADQVRAGCAAKYGPPAVRFGDSA